MGKSFGSFNLILVSSLLFFLLAFQEGDCQKLKGKNKNGKKGRNSSDKECEKPFGNFQDPTQCDAYFECKEGRAKRRTCPNGLMFNGNSEGYPCSYPQEVDCGKREKIQEAESNEDCPNQNGLFPEFEDSEDCGGFINCVSGRSFKQKCPEGLAFNPSSGRCAWPDEVETCDAESFLGFKCPQDGDSSKNSNESSNKRINKNKGKGNKKQNKRSRIKRNARKKKKNSTNSNNSTSSRIKNQYFYLGRRESKIEVSEQVSGSEEILSLELQKSNTSSSPIAEERPEPININGRKRVNNIYFNQKILQNSGDNWESQRTNKKIILKSPGNIWHFKTAPQRPKLIKKSRNDIFHFQPKYFGKSKRNSEGDWESEQEDSSNWDEYSEESKVNTKKSKKPKERDSEASDKEGSGESEAEDDNPKFPHVDDCRKFFVCVNGTKPRLLRCNFGQVFNPETSFCDDQENVSKWLEWTNYLIQMSNHFVNNLAGIITQKM